MVENVILAYKEDGEDLAITDMSWMDVMQIELGYLTVSTNPNCDENARSLTDVELTDLTAFFQGNLQIRHGIRDYKATLKDTNFPINDLLRSCYVVK